jgi:dihydropteroate synthase
VITLSALAALAAAHADDLDVPVAPVRIGDREFPCEGAPLVMGCINLSRDSTYRESIATSTESAIRKGRVLAEQGADVIDIGSESSTARASRVEIQQQIDQLVPVIQELAADELLVSAETYEPEVAKACLEAGAQVLNFTGAEHQDAIFELAATFKATVVLCQVRGANVREISDVDLDADPLPGILEHFEPRVAIAREAGVDRLILDPGMGFYYGNLTDPTTRVRHQTRVITNTFRLRRLGLPVCHALPHAFDLFEDQFRSAEAFFAVLAMLGGTSVLRTHEVARVSAVVRAMRTLDVS